MTTCVTFQQLIDALVREDIRSIILVLGHCMMDDINAPYSKDDGRTALHIAAALGNVVYVQMLLWVSRFVVAVKFQALNCIRISWYCDWNQLDVYVSVEIVEHQTSFVCQSQKCNLGHIIWSIDYEAFVFGIHIHNPCVKNSKNKDEL